jgi:hypothetical protein
MKRLPIAVVIAALLFGTVVAARDGPVERLPEPAHQFAKEAARAMLEEEHAWKELATRLDALLSSCQKAETVGNSLHVEAADLLALYRRVITAHQDIDRHLRQFQALLDKTAEHYREVSELYTAEARRAKSDSVRADYRALATAYQQHALAATARSRAIGLPPAIRQQAALVEEATQFLERFTEVTAAVPLAEPDERPLAKRLDSHRKRAAALVTGLAAAARAVLAGTAESGSPRIDSELIDSTKPQPITRSTLKAGEPRRSPYIPRSSFPVRYISPTGDWAGLVAGPQDLSVGDELTFERSGTGVVGRLRVESYKPDQQLFIVRALRAAHFLDGDVVRR